MSEVASVHIASATAFLDDGQALPITDACDEEGEACDLAECAVCVAGPDRNGRWIVIDLREFVDAVLQ